MSAALVLFLTVVAAACGGTPPGDLEISLVPATPARVASVKVTGFSSDELSALRGASLENASWNSILSVYVAGNEALPVAGSYSIGADALEFTPRFPFDPGRTYVVRVDPRRLPQPREAPVVGKVLQMPAAPEGARTAVTSIAPTGGAWPENILRFYIQFSAPMSRASALGFVRLVDEAGVEVREAFLPLDVDLWNADRTRFTVFFDPGRVKRGIRPNVELGRALHAGRRYAVVVDAKWPDAQGRPLSSEFRYPFTAGAPEERPVQPVDWHIAAPPAGSRNALVLTFPWGLDRGLLQRAVGVRNAQDASLDGAISIDEGERVWRFTPAAAWRAGDHHLVVLPILEDPAGNRVGRAFEIAMFQKAGGDMEKTVTRRFLVK